MAYLLDVNVLIARADPRHESHNAVRAWLAAVDLHDMRALPNAAFVPDDVSINDTALFSSISDLTPRQLTDVYLLGLAVSKGARFATLDGRVPADSVRGGRDALTVIPQE